MLSQPTLTRRVAIRFAIVYFALYSVGTPIVSYILTTPGGGYVAHRPAYRLVSWVGAHVFGRTSLDVDPGSLDRVFDWIQLFTFAVMALAVAAAWTIRDLRRRDDGRGRERDARLDAWLRTGLRFALGGVLVFYGVEKVYPMQMIAPDITRLLQPVGSLSPQDLLWTQVGAALPYEAFIGILEVAAAVLLFVPATASAGAVLAFLETVYILALDLTYDIPVKLFAGHLVLMSAVLLAPEVPRLLNVLLHRRTVAPAPPVPLFKTTRAHQLATAAQILFGVYVVVVGLMHGRQAWVDRDLLNAAMGPLYGGWNVDVMSVDGQVQPPLVNTDGRWRRVVFEQGGAFVQRMDDTFAPHSASVDAGRKIVTLARDREPGWLATLTFAQPERERLVLDGAMDGRAVHLELKWFGRNSFPLVSHGFHLIQESPNSR